MPRGRLAVASTTFSDIITPGPVKISYPTILGQPPARLQVYNRETVVAEKLEAMVKLGELNSRMKDFFDVGLLASNSEFDGRLLGEAVRRTFERRRTRLEPDPICFRDAFATAPSKGVQWNAFIRRGLLSNAPPEFADIIEQVREFLQPVVTALVEEQDFDLRWPRGGPWQPRS